VGIDKAARKKSGKIVGPFMYFTHRMMESAAYIGLSAHAIAMLNEFAMLYNGRNNGSLIGSMAHFEKRGWNSRDMVQKARKELLDAGFLFQTVQGHRPNKASHFAVTWQPLDNPVAPLEYFDAGVPKAFIPHEYEKK
jgi:hypothetical protein